MSLALLFHHLLLSMFRMLVHPSSGACDLLWIYFMCCIALVRCVLVLRCGSTGVVWYPDAGWSTCFINSLFTDQHVSNVSTSIFRSLRLTVTLTPTQIEPEKYNTLNKCTESRKLLEMDVLTFETCSPVNCEIMKRVTWSWSIFIQLSRWCTVQ
jgi:hypothetical protein